MKQRGLTATREEIKERIKAKNNKIKRYQSRINQYEQNHTFKNNQRKFYRALNSGGRNYEMTEIAFDVNEKWYKHEPEKVVENDSWKILWDFTIQTDHIIETRRPDMIKIDKTKNKCKIINFACPFDGRIKKREKDKMKDYNDLKRNPCSSR